MVGLGKHEVAEGLCDETELALVEIAAGAAEDSIGTSHIFDKLPARLHRRKRIEIGGIGVVPAEIFLVDRLHVMPDVTIVPACMPGAFETLGQPDRLGDFRCSQAVIHQP